MPGLVIGGSGHFVGEGWVGDGSLTSGTIVAVGQVTETDLAQAIGKQKIKAIGQVTETDLAQAITVRKIKAIGQVTETDLAQAIAWAPKHRLTNQVTETDLAQAIQWTPKNRSVVQVVETDLAQPISVVIVPTSTDPGWLGGAPGGRKRRAWPLPPPAFPIIEEAPEVLTLGKAEPVPKWVKVVESEPVIKTDGPQYIPSKPEPVESKPRRIPRRIQARIVEHKEQGPTADEIIREWRRREEEEVVMALIMQGEL